jgi:hypothetical protein
MSRAANAKANCTTASLTSNLKNAELNLRGLQMVKVVLSEFFHPKTANAIHSIHLKIDNDLEGAAAQTEVEDEDTRPRAFIISFNPKYIQRYIEIPHQREEFMRLVAHEMLHVRQFTKRQLKSTIVVGNNGLFEPGFVWEGKVWNPPKGMPPKHRYWMSPWEMEARAHEEPAFHFWFEQYDPELKWASWRTLT